MLWHRYTLDGDGTIVDARIVPPTSQNQPTIEDDLRAVVGDHAASTTTSSRSAASRRSATTTRASRAPRTSSTSRSSASDGARSSASATTGAATTRPDWSPRAACADARPGVRVVELDGDPARCSTRGRTLADAIVIDAVRSGAPPGTIHRIDLAGSTFRAGPRHGSTHGLGVAEAVELARALDRLPERLELYGIEAGGFETGTGLTPPVARAVEALCGELRAQLSARR